MDGIKENFFNQLNKNIKELQTFDIATLMSLLYVLVAYKEGCRLTLVGGKDHHVEPGKKPTPTFLSVDGCESDLLKEIRGSVDTVYFEGQTAEVAFRFYEMCRAFTGSEFYQEVVEYLISYYSSRAGVLSGLDTTPTTIAQLMAGLIKETQPACIYDPCAGLCSYLIQPALKDCAFVGQDINLYTKVIADVRLDAADKKATVYNEDSIANWRGDEGCDCLASELPFGVLLKVDEQNPERPEYLEDAVIDKFIKSPSLKKAVLLVSIGTCYRPKNRELRKLLCDNNWIDTVIKLPAGVLTFVSIHSAVVVLNKERTTNKVRFVSAEDCFLKEGRKSVLDYQSVFNRLSSAEDRQTATVEHNAIVERDYSLDPSIYLQEKIDLLPGQKLVKFTDLVTPIKGLRIFPDSTGRVLKIEHFCKNIAEMHTREIDIPEVKIPSYSVRICGKCIIFHPQVDKFFIKNDEEPLYVIRGAYCFVVNEDKCIPEYLVESVVNAEIFENMRGGLEKIDWDNLLLPFYEDLESQKQIVNRKYREEENQLKQKLEKIQLLSGKSSDLIHNLGVTFTKISAGVSQMATKGEDEIVESMRDNVQFALRQINSTGTDFGFVQPEKRKVNLYDMLLQYIKAWDNFGYHSFSILPLMKGMSEDTKVEVDTDLFYTMLDCIFINAHQHGFSKHEDPDHKLLIKVDGVIYQGEKYVCIGISNNGKPLPADFGLSDFVKRGVVGINSSQDGIGGDHVCKIVHKHNGFISIDSNSDWLTFNILLPVYLTSNETNFNDYECECI